MVNFTRKTLLEVTSAIVINITSGWFGALLVATGAFGVASLDAYAKLLLFNMPLGILGLVISLWLTEKGKSL